LATRHQHENAVKSQEAGSCRRGFCGRL